MESPRTRIKRKPPPLVDAALAADLRYPSPDPSDPFAPLWALRTRGSCGSLRHASNLRADAPQESPLRTESIHSSAVTDESPSKWSSGLFKRTNRMQASPSASSSLVHVSMPTTNCCIAGADDAHSLLQPAPTEWLFPTPSQLAYAASLPVVAPSGLRVPFASLFETHPTVIIFLRHFWCPLCQDYSASIASTLPSNTAAPSPRIILIGNGSPSYITKYLALFGLNRHSSIEMYTDPTLAVYAALGMKRSSSPPSSTPPSTKSTPQTKLPSHSAENAISPDAKKSYIRHGSVSGVALVVLRGLKAGLPIWEPGGNIHQLGGEFVLGPGLTCTYAHRMQSPRGHAPISDVLAAAGIDVPVPMGTATANPPASQATPPPSSLSSSSALPFPSPHSSPLSSPSKPSQQQKQRLENSPVQPITGSRALAHAKSSSTSMSFGQYMATLWTKRNLVAPSPSLPLGSAVSASPTRPYKSRLPAHQPSSTAVNSGSFNAKNNNKPVESLSRSKGNKLKKRSASMGTHPLMSPAPGLGACVDHVPVRRGAGGAGAGADVGRKVGHRGVFGVWYGDRGSASFDLPPLTQGRERAATMPFLCHLNSDVTRTRSLDLQRPSPPSHGICAPRGQRNDGDEDEGDVTDEEDEEEWVRARAEEMEAMMEKKRIRREKGHREGGGTGPRSGSASASAPSPVPVGIGREPESVREGEAEVMIIGFGNDVGVESG